MDYEKLFEKKRKLDAGADEEARQAAMELGMRLVVDSQENPSPRIHDMMKKSFVSCSEKEKTLTLAYEVEEWELNPIDTMHGGLIATAIDTTCGMAVRYFSECLRTPTVSMTIDYIRPVPETEKLFVTVKVVRIGKSIANLTAEASVSGGKVAATATAVFMIKK